VHRKLPNQQRRKKFTKLPTEASKINWENHLKGIYKHRR
jgi:hypothetical protein